jgi:hypothetical protein
MLPFAPIHQRVDKYIYESSAVGKTYGTKVWCYWKHRGEHFENSKKSLVSHTQFNIFNIKTTIPRSGELQTPTNYSIKVSGFSLLKKEVIRKKNIGEEGNRLELWKT